MSNFTKGVNEFAKRDANDFFYALICFLAWAGNSRWPETCDSLSYIHSVMNSDLFGF